MARRNIASFVLEGKPFLDLDRSASGRADHSTYSWTKGVETSRSFIKGNWMDGNSRNAGELIVAVDGSFAIPRERSSCTATSKGLNLVTQIGHSERLKHRATLSRESISQSRLAARLDIL